MFGLGGMEILVILLVGVVVLGPERLPKVMRSFTKLMSEFRRISTDLQRTINSELNLEEYNRQQKLESIKQPVKKKKKKKAAPKPPEDNADVTPADKTGPVEGQAPVMPEATGDATPAPEAPAKNDDSGDKA